MSLSPLFFANMRIGIDLYYQAKLNHKKINLSSLAGISFPLIAVGHLVVTQPEATITMLMN